MAEPTVVFNSSTGSDTEASGAGPSTAVYGASAAHTSGVASTTITLTNSPDLSGVATDGSHVLWLKTASGRQFSKITGKDDVADTVTVDDSFNIALASAVNYAIGGKRATWNNADSRTLFGATTSIGFKAGWTVVTETNQTITTSALSMTGTGTVTAWITIKGDSTTSRRVINQEGNAALFSGTSGISHLFFENLQLTHSNATKTNAWGAQIRTGPAKAVNCVFGDPVNKLQFAMTRDANCPVIFYSCEFQYHTNANGPFEFSKQAGSLSFVNCYSHHNTGVGFNTGENGYIVNCIAAFNGTDGIRVLTGVDSIVSNSRLVANCTCHGNTGDGIDISGGDVAAVLINNNVTGNGGYGIRGNSTDNFLLFADHNNFGTGATANTSGARLNVATGANDVELDPQYVDAANGNFEIGTNLKAKGFPKSSEFVGLNSLTNSFVDIGAAQREEAGGVRQVNIRGGSDQ